MRPLLLLASLLAAVAGCSDAVPCQTCPDVAGTYTLGWSDGGATDQPCDAPGPRPGMLTLRQSRSIINATVGEVALSGTLYDTYDLTMTGLTSSESYQLRALVTPTGTSLDGGIRLTGTLLVRRSGTDDGGCDTRDAFEGTKNR